MVIFGSMLGAVCCFLMPAAGSLGVLIGVWAANGLFQSMLWSPILRVFSETIDESLSKKAILNIALSLPVGTVLAYLMSSMIIKYLNWKYVFIFGGSVVVIAVLFAGFAIFCSEKDIEKVSVIQKQNAEAHNNFNKKGLAAVAVSSGLLFIMIPSFLHGMMRDGITNWVPAMISEVCGVSTSFSVFVTIALPIFNAFGAYLVTPLYKKLGENEMKTAGVTGFAALVPVRFSKFGFTSGISGILNSGAHIGCALSSYGFGAISEKAGWSAVIIVWIVSSVLITVFSFASNKRWSRFLSE